MSGGHFNYMQSNINLIADEIENMIENNKSDEMDEYGYYNFSDETINQFKKAVHILRLAHTYVNRIDWLVSGDDSEETFVKRLEKEISEIENTSKDQ